MRRRASIALARFYSRFFLWTGPRRSAVPGLPMGGVRPSSWAWLLHRVRRRTAPARKRQALADSSPTRARQHNPARDADSNPAVPNNVKLANVIPIDVRASVKPPLQRRVVVIADCENDTDSVAASLRFVGLLGKRGKLKAKARGAHIIQTGDLLHKNRPDPRVVGFWERLRDAAEATDCALHLVAGNHELEIWRRLQSGARLGLKRCEQQAVRGLIRSTKLFHAEGSMLFMHGYPTVELLRDVHAYRTDRGNKSKSLNDYNKDCFQAAFDDLKLLARYAYLRGNACRNSLLRDVPNPGRYYRRHGREVATLLDALGIDLVVHGHRPERSGLQTDYELQRLLPGIRMISHDIQLRLQGLGATVIRRTEKGPTDLFFVNKINSTPAHRADIRRVLRAPKRPVVLSTEPRKMKPEGQISNLVRNKDSMAPAFAVN